ncbi:hypothetical protein PhaeoP83_00737 [Phaeobacter inhibens]|uniref:Uncharacterized protein n=1 Tax=Phaeobacter inhibens TaxID=221822 RepID=A0A2I7JT67_9RHOB|nr:hypothetical protein PhaeoP83_00737 [Phaeobacter inhibens]AUQ93543.1 hypothetical protein PhaeoP66_00730 [Phaeobacter inhibens]AUQ99977.1 hypothetical protein PhaeoP88_02632 [Phaeobacter inhibens]AUR18846.1 hypothetical protein PhaeoP80_00737 [Phaeobacter inhibens]
MTADLVSACSIAAGRDNVRAGCSRIGEAVAVLEIRGRICYRTSATWWTSICLMNTSVPLPRFGRFHFEGSFLHRRFSWISWVQKRPAPEREAPLPAFGEDSNLPPIREEFLFFYSTRYNAKQSSIFTPAHLMSTLQVVPAPGCDTSFSNPSSQTEIRKRKGRYVFSQMARSQG